MNIALLSIGVVALLGLATLVAFFLRRVVSTNEVHIVQSAKKTTSYGKDTGNGNTYYAWPSFLPVIGITKIILPVSVFDLDLAAYEAYDKDRVPFVVDIKAFFRISESAIAAQRVSSFQELHNQLKAIVQGSVRTILASNEIGEIMQGRSKFGTEFTKEVDGQLASWGVATVKSIELMDIRDSRDSHVIKNIMEKKKSHIEMESRTEVALNMQKAQIAEINAKQAVELQQQVALQAVGLRKVENQRQVELSTQEANQVIIEQKRTTKEKEMAVLKVEMLRKAEIDQNVQTVNAETNKQVATLLADGQLEARKREAEGITVEGTAKASAEKAMQLAPIEAQITLAKEIGNNENYQRYLINLRQVEANEAVGMKQAEALKEADVKIISNTGDVSSGATNVMDLFTSSGGTKMGAMLEGLAQTPAGQKVLSKVGL
jgi:flotillin